jgi:hypothetical protein
VRLWLERAVFTASARRLLKVERGCDANTSAFLRVGR